jgi:hypothetical protein
VAVTLARGRGTLLLIIAAGVPIAFLMVQRPTLYDGIRHILFVIPMLAILAAGAFLRLLSLLRRFPAIAAAVLIVAAVHVGVTLVTLEQLHPLQYVAMNSLAGGTAGAAGRFELDYWGAAATTALRQLEGRLDSDRSGQFASEPPRVFGCILHRASAMGKLFRRNWQVELDASKADFIIETERWRCASGSAAKLIDEVKRLDVPLAWIYANNRGRNLNSQPGHGASAMSPALLNAEMIAKRVHAASHPLFASWHGMAKLFLEGGISDAENR